MKNKKQITINVLIVFCLTVTGCAIHSIESEGNFLFKYYLACSILSLLSFIVSYVVLDDLEDEE